MRPDYVIYVFTIFYNFVVKRLERYKTNISIRIIFRILCIVRSNVIIQFILVNSAFLKRGFCCNILAVLTIVIKNVEKLKLHYNYLLVIAIFA